MLTITLKSGATRFLADSTWTYLYVSSLDGIYKINISSWEVIRHSRENADYFIKYPNIIKGKIYKVQTLICQLMSWMLYKISILIVNIGKHKEGNSVLLINISQSQNNFVS